MALLPNPLLIVVDKAACAAAGRQTADLARAVLEAGARWLWYRNWVDSPAVRLAEAAELVELTAAAGASLQIGGDEAAELTAAVGAGGAHLPGSGSTVAWARTLTNGLVGRSCHDFASVRRAQAEGADYVTLSPIFETTSAKDPARASLGPAALAGIVDVVRVPVVALGGIVPERVAVCLRAGARAVAVLGYVCGAPEPDAAVKALLRAVEAAQL